MLLRVIRLGCLLASTASAAYVQWRHCDHAPGDNLPTPASLGVVLSHDHVVNFDLQAYFEAGSQQCRALADDLSLHVELQALGWSQTLDKSEVQPSCVDMYGQSYLVANISEHVDGLYPLATFGARLQLIHGTQGEIACIKGNVVPQLQPATLAALRWTPFAILMTVLAVGIALTIHDQRAALIEENEQAPPERPILPRVGDCLQYLQFVFLTACLSIHYPGFFQPAVSQLEWYSLFFTVPISRGPVYNGVNDGIYEMNGTYGGTFGLEIMHQIVGAPRTFYTWLNMVLVLGSIALAAALLLEGLRWWQLRSISHVFQPPSSTETDGLSHHFRRVLRIIFSYFTMPAVSMSFYQLAWGNLLPKYHIAMASVLVVLLIAGFVWLLCKVPTHSLGVLVFDSAKRYQALPTEEVPSPPRHTSFVLVLFVVAFIRGVAVGGVQLLGAAQLAVLGTCELVLLASIYGFQAYSLHSVHTVAALARLLTVALMVCFLPDMVDLKTKSAIGYAILALHTCMLLFGFGGAACRDLWYLCRDWPRPVEPDAYGLNDLRRRDVSSMNLSTAQLRSPSLREDAFGGPFSPYMQTSYHHESRSSRYSSSIADTDRYFRAPRASSLRSKQSVDMTSLAASQETSTLKSPRPSARTVSPLVGASVSHFTPIQEHGAVFTAHSPLSTSSESGTRSSSSQDSQTSTSQSNSDGADDGRPLGPRWRDYTFRESDLFYGVAGTEPQEESIADVAVPRHGGRPESSIRKVSSGMWSKLTGKGQDAEPVEKGFSVSRPPRTDHGRGFPPGTAGSDHEGRNSDQEGKL